MHLWWFTRSPESGKKASEKPNLFLEQFGYKALSARPPLPPLPTTTYQMIDRYHRIVSGGLWWYFSFTIRPKFCSNDLFSVHVLKILLDFIASTAVLMKFGLRMLVERL